MQVARERATHPKVSSVLILILTTTIGCSRPITYSYSMLTKTASGEVKESDRSDVKHDGRERGDATARFGLTINEVARTESGLHFVITCRVFNRGWHKTKEVDIASGDQEDIWFDDDSAGYRIWVPDD